MNAPHRPIKSFVVRAGRMGSGQVRAIEDLGPRFIVPYATQPFDAATTFGRQAPLVVEIGFGMGDATASIAAAQSSNDFLGIEVHPPGVGALLKHIGERGLTNVRIVQHDAVEVLEHMLAPQSLAGVNVFFPDPWHKKRHHKRRLIQPALVSLLASRLAPGGTLHCATDWQPYAEQMLEVLSSEPLLENTVANAADKLAPTPGEAGDAAEPGMSGGYAPRPDHRPLTKFENRGLRLGHGVWDLVFRRA